MRLVFKRCWRFLCIWIILMLVSCILQVSNLMSLWFNLLIFRLFNVRFVGFLWFYWFFNLMDWQRLISIINLDLFKKFLFNLFFCPFRSIGTFWSFWSKDFNRVVFKIVQKCIWHCSFNHLAFFKLRSSLISRSCS